MQACLAVPSFCAALTNISPLSSFSSKVQLPLSTLASAVPPFSAFSHSKSPFSSSSKAKSTLQSLFPSRPILVVHPRQIEIELAAFLCQMREHTFFKQKSRPGKILSLGKRSFWRSWRLQPGIMGNHFNKMRWR